MNIQFFYYIFEKIRFKSNHYIIYIGGIDLGIFCNRRSLRWKILILSIIIILCIIPFIPSVASIDSKYKITASIKSNELDYDKIRINPIEASSHYDYGQKLFQQHPGLKVFFRVWSNTYIFYKNELESYINAWTNDPDEKFDDFLDEFQGIADVLGLNKLERVLYMGRLLLLETPLGFILSILSNDCTNTAATKDATDTKDKTFIHQNIDLAGVSDILWRILSKTINIAKIDGEYDYAFFSIPVLGEWPFLNEKDVGFVGTGLRLGSEDVDTSENLTAMPSIWLVRRAMMDCDHVVDTEGQPGDVLDLYTSTDRASGEDMKWPRVWNNQNSIWCDGLGNILAIEQMNHNFVSKTENPNNPQGFLQPNILWHTNHHMWLDHEDTGSIPPDHDDDRPNSFIRAERAYELLTGNNYGELNQDYFENIIAKDQENEGHEEIDQILNPNTRESYIIQSNPDDDKWFYWSRGRPSENEEFIKRSFDAILKKESINSIPMTSYESCTEGYYYQSGSIPYLLNELANYDYFYKDYVNDTNYTLNMIMFASISDSLIGNKEQSNHDYTISRTNEIDTSNDTFFVTLVADGIVNASLNTDDSVNKTWNTIQKAVDNMTNLDILIVENGTYDEDIVLNKSIIIFGEDEETTIIDGSITMNNPHDYELLQETDYIANVNMTGISLLMHFNNHSLIGENYSNSTNINDYSPLGNNGTNNNASFTTNTIKGEGAFLFNGTSNSINLPSIPALTGENVTLSSWIYWKEGTGNTDTILSQSNDTLGYCLYVNSTNDIPKFRLDSTSVDASSSISEGWHNIVGTHNQTTLKIYIDGVFSNSTSKSGSGSDRYAFIGYDNISSYFNGTIDEIAVWNRTLNSTEIFHIYDQHFGVVIDGFTIKNSNIGIKPVNHTDITNCIIQNHTTGILIENISDIKIECNFTECDTALEINNTNPDEFNKIRVMDSYLDGNTNGININNTSNIDIYRISINDSVTPLEINNSNYSYININNTLSTDNSSPDIPDISGPSLGDIETNYTYYVYTNDTDGDPYLFYIDWGDGNNTGWFGPLFPSYPVHKRHSWTEQGGYYVKTKAKDIFYNETSWSIPILFKTETNPPIINMVNDTPDPVGFGYNVTITANVTENTTSNYSGIKTVRINITYPDDSYKNLTMKNIGNNTYQRVFTDWWNVGQYNYVIWATDNAYNTASSTGHSFTYSVDATISICTINSSYGGNETINLTDPPSSSYLVGYELLDDGEVLHIWNKYDSYYFNTSSGIQLTNHYDEYWSHNVLMLGYYNNDDWNLIYRTDELSGFNKDIESDNETFVNVTLWKNLNYAGYDFRLAIRYYLGADDNELTIIPYIKNIDNEDIPYNLGFAWEIKDIQIDMTEENDYIDIDGTTYYLNASGLNETYTNLDIPSFIIKENISDDKTESLYLRWDENLNYKIQVKSRTGQYNAPVTLGIKIGILDVGQEKYTELFWYDACKATYFFNGEDLYNIWATNPSYMTDGSTQYYASTTVNMDIETLNSNTCIGADLGTISKVEIRAFGKYSGSGIPPIHDIFLKTLSGIHVFSPSTTGAWSSWYDITNNPSAPNTWTWTDVDNLNVDVQASIGGLFTMYCSKIEIQVTYNAYPGVSNIYPANGANGIPISPVMNLTVSDDDGDTMNITWWSNSSGSWQIFGTNNSVSNGTYHQTFSNATVNGQWWYWKYNVSDGTNHVESNVMSFYTGYQSKIENTGSTKFKGYLLMQIEYYNTTSTAWELDQIVINETTPRIFNASSVLGLDTLFNPYNVSTSNLSFGNGTYRVYACLRNPVFEILDIGSELVATYQFTVSTS